MAEQNSDGADVPAVSVVLPSYNRAYCLSRAVESVLRQTYADLELIIVDDCSTDDTQAYLATVTDPRVVKLRHEINRGGAAARNTGIAAARAPVIAFQDSDDEWCVTMLDKQMQRRADAGPDYLVSYCAKIVHGRDNHGNFGARYAAYMPAPASKVVEGDVLAQVLQTAIASTQTLVIDAALLRDVGGFDEQLRVGLDWELTIRLARRTKFAFIEEPLVMTYLMADSITHRRVSGAHTAAVIMAKHADLFAADAGLRADYAFRIGRIHQRAGDHRTALPHLARALRADRPRTWAAYGLGLLKRPLSA